MVILNLFIDYHYKNIIKHQSKACILLFTCPQLTEESSLLAAAARTHLHMLCNFYQIESIPQFLELWPSFNAICWNTNFTLLYRNATTYGINVYFVFSSNQRLIYMGFTFIPSIMLFVVSNLIHKSNKGRTSFIMSLALTFICT